MATLVLEEGAISIAPFKLREMRQAAPHIDAVMSARRTTEQGRASMGDAAEIIHSVSLVLCVGIRRSMLDGRLSPDIAQSIPMTRAAPLDTQLDQICDWLEGQTGMGSMAELNRCFYELMEESGMKKADSDPTRGVPAPEDSQSS